jgi:tripartite-type tricarboxylate transporter receptor subunit TctC
VVDRVNSEIARVIKAPEMTDRLHAVGVSPVGGTPEQLLEQIRKEIEQWRTVVAAAKIRVH